MELFNSQNSDVAVLGNVVIRRPRNPEAIAGVRREAAVLPRLFNQLALPVPVMQIVEVGNEMVALHSRLPGKPLWSVQDLGSSTQTHLATQLGSFLTSLHAIEPAVLRDVDLPCINQEWWTGFLDKAERLVFPKLTSKIAQGLHSQIQSHIEQLPDLPCVLRHGDFGSSNILWDGEKTITGIIDFGSLGWGDPGWDIAGLSASYDSLFVEQMTSTYPLVRSLLVRSPFYHQMFALMDAVFGVEHADNETLKDGVETLWNSSSSLLGHMNSLPPSLEEPH